MSKFSEIKMDDSGGSQHISWRAEKDYDALIKNDKTEKVGNNELHIVTTDFKREIHGNQSVTIGANDKLTIGAQNELKVKGSRDVTVGATESIDIGGGEQITTTGGESETVGGLRLNLVGSIKIPDFGNMAKSALTGLNPLPAIQAKFQNPLNGIMAGSQNALSAGLNAGQSPSALVQSALTGAQSSLGSSVGGALSLGGLFTPPSGAMQGAGGFLPSVDQLRQMYTSEALQQNLTARVDGALNSATGGLLDSFYPKGQNGQREFKLGWDQADKLIDTFTIGGVSKTAVNSITVMVGGASIKASLGPFEWGSKIAWLETIGGLKATLTPKAIDQDVAKTMILTVLGKVKRVALACINIRSEVASSIKVLFTAKYESKLVEINGVNDVLIEADDEIVFNGGGSTITMKPGSVVLKGPLVKIDSKKEAFLIGNKLQVSK